MRKPMTTRSATLAALLFLGVASPAWAQDNDAKNIKLRDEKLQSAFLKNAPWITDFDKAQAEAKKTGKPIFAYFTRSYSP